jgi:hypothetical protein
VSNVNSIFFKANPSVEVGACLFVLRRRTWTSEALAFASRPPGKELQPELFLLAVS